MITDLTVVFGSRRCKSHTGKSGFHGPDMYVFAALVTRDFKHNTPLSDKTKSIVELHTGPSYYSQHTSSASKIYRQAQEWMDKTSQELSEKHGCGRMSICDWPGYEGTEPSKLDRPPRAKRTEADGSPKYRFVVYAPNVRRCGYEVPAEKVQKLGEDHPNFVVIEWSNPDELKAICEWLGPQYFRFKLRVLQLIRCR